MDEIRFTYQDKSEGIVIGSGQQEADEIQTSGKLPDPSEHVEDYQTGMKTREEDIKNFHLILVKCTYVMSILYTKLCPGIPRTPQLSSIQASRNGCFVIDGPRRKLASI